MQNSFCSKEIGEKESQIYYNVGLARNKQSTF